MNSVAPDVTPQSTATFLESFPTDVTSLQLGTLTMHQLHVAVQGCLIAVTLTTVCAYYSLQLFFHQAFQLLYLRQFGMYCSQVMSESVTGRATPNDWEGVIAEGTGYLF